MKLLAKRLRRMGENQTGAENTNRENRRIASLAVWSFGGDQFSTFWDGNSLRDDGTGKTARKTYLQGERRYLRAL